MQILLQLGGGGNTGHWPNGDIDQHSLRGITLAISGCCTQSFWQWDRRPPEWSSPGKMVINTGSFPKLRESGCLRVESGHKHFWKAPRWFFPWHTKTENDCWQKLKSFHSSWPAELHCHGNVLDSRLEATCSNVTTGWKAHYCSEMSEESQLK